MKQVDSEVMKEFMKENLDSFFFTMLDMVDEYCRKEAELIYKEMYEEEKRERKEVEKKLKEKELRLRMKATELAIKLGATQEDIDAIFEIERTTSN